MLGLETLTKVGIGICFVAGVSFVIAAVFELKKSPTSGWRVFMELAAGLSGIAIAVVTFLHDDEDPALALDITSPANGDQVTYCTKVRVAGTLPDGKTLVVANREGPDVRTFFEADIQSTHDDSWTSDARLGESGPLSVDTDFSIFAIVMDDDLAEYLSTVTPPDDDSDGEEDEPTYWSSPGDALPPGAVIADQVDVHRSDDPTDCDAPSSP